jgi:methionyl-tRNA synthetase
MIGRYCDGRVPVPGEPTAEEISLQTRCTDAVAPILDAVERLAINDAVARSMDLVSEINGYLERTAPWTQAKAGEDLRVRTILYTGAEALRLAAVLLYPVMPERMGELTRRLGWHADAPSERALAWGALQPDCAVSTGAPLFPRDIA